MAACPAEPGHLPQELVTATSRFHTRIAMSLRMFGQDERVNKGCEVTFRYAGSKEVTARAVLGNSRLTK